ncbi:hypothetical protein NB2BOR_A03470 [Bordetella parapertussis]|nr:hypothetical protein NB2BOR_A03470 [Bordetella parapertussis]
MNTLAAEFDSFFIMLAMKPTSRAHADIAGGHVGVRAQVAVQFQHQRLAETHHLGVRFALGVEVGAALAAAHGQGGQRVLQGLFESQELQHRQIDRRVEAHAALEGADGRAVLDAEGAVDLGLALVIGPADAELDHAFGLDQAFQQGVLGVMRVLLDEGPEAQHDLLDCLHEFGLLRIARGNPAQEAVQTLQFQDTASWQCDGAARCVAVQKRREVVRGCTLLVRNCGPKFVGRKAGIGRKACAGAACRKE